MNTNLTNHLNNENQPAMQTLTRKSNQWTTTQELRSLLKTNLGLNSRQVSVSKGHSTQYLTITIRDACVNIAKVKEFAKSFNTWNMDITDCVTGQSIEVKTTDEVDVIHAANFIEEIKATIPFCEVGSGQPLSNGCVLWLDKQGFYVGRDQKRMHYIYEFDVRKGTDWAIQGLALQVARI